MPPTESGPSSLSVPYLSAYLWALAEVGPPHGADCKARGCYLEAGPCPRSAEVYAQHGRDPASVRVYSYEALVRAPASIIHDLVGFARAVHAYTEANTSPH